MVCSKVCRLFTSKADNCREASVQEVRPLHCQRSRKSKFQWYSRCTNEYNKELHESDSDLGWRVVEQSWEAWCELAAELSKRGLFGL